VVVELKTPILCHECKGELREIAAFRKLARVTSDARPWASGGKLAVCQDCGLAQAMVDRAWHRECGKIYSSYKIYSQAGGAEQAVFIGNSSAPRSRRLVRWLSQYLDLPTHGKLLDIGCGNGGFLREFQRQFPKWKLYGTEYDQRNRKILKRIPGFQKLYSRHQRPTGQHFDLVCMIHVLEHQPSPSRFIAQAAKYAKPGSPLFIQVPDAEDNPYILPVADHANHFCGDSLKQVVTRAGLLCTKRVGNPIPRELSCIGFNLKEAEVQVGMNCFVSMQKSVNRLTEYARASKREATLRPLVIFGSSIGATWLYGACKGKVQSFLDEDLHKVGRRHLGVPILALTTIQKSNNQKIWLPSNDIKLRKKLLHQGRKIRKLTQRSR
jgi:SAM-dependent methyltransferase